MTVQIPTYGPYPQHASQTVEGWQRQCRSLAATLGQQCQANTQRMLPYILAQLAELDKRLECSIGRARAIAERALGSDAQALGGNDINKAEREPAGEVEHINEMVAHLRNDIADLEYTLSRLEKL